MDMSKHVLHEEAIFPDLLNLAGGYQAEVK